MKLTPIAYIVAAVGIMGMIGPVNAQSEWEAAQEEGAQRIDAFVRKIKKIPVMKVDFNYIIESREDHLKEEMPGTLFLHRSANRLRVELPDQLIIADGKNIWVIQKDLKEITKDRYNPADEQLNPFRLLENYKDNFLYAAMGQATAPDGRPAELVELTPHDKDLDYFKVKLFFTPSNDLRFFQIYDRGGIIYTFEIEHLERYTKPSNGLFSVSPSQYAGYTVTDLTQ